MISIAISLTLLLPVFPHTEAEQQAWETAWQQEVEAKRALSPRLLAEYVDFHTRHLPPAPTPQPSTPEPQTSSTYVGIGSNVEQWRGLVAAHFSDVNRALCLMKYESGGNPNATSYAGARGLMQVMPFWARHLGLAPDALYDPATNLRVAAYVYGQQGWWAWSPYKRGLCR